MNDKFNIKRFLQLVNNDIETHKKSLLIYFAATLVICFIASIIIPTSNYGYGPKIYFPHISVIVILMIVLVSFSFYELDYTDKGINYLTIPATLFEKYFCRWIMTIIGYLLAGCAIYIVYVLLLYVLNLPYSRVAHEKGMYDIINPVNMDFIKVIGYYLLLHSIFFFGAIYFKKNEFLKTLMWIAIIATFCFALLFLLHKILIPDLKISFFTVPDIKDVADWKRVMEYNKYRTGIWELIRDILFYFVPPFLWILGYFRLREEEVINGVQ